MAFQGSLAELHLPDIIQLVSVSGKTGVFHLAEGSHKGRIFLLEGRIVHAELDDVLGEEAVYSLAIWKEGEFRFEAGVAAPRHTITKSNTNLLMEAARRLDEWRVLSKKIPSVDLVPEFMLLENREGQINLNTVEWLLLSKIDGLRSLKGIAAATGLSVFDAAKVLYGLVAAGLIRLKEPSGPALATRPAAAVASSPEASGPEAQPAPPAASAAAVAPIPVSAPPEAPSPTGLLLRRLVRIRDECVALLGPVGESVVQKHYQRARSEIERGAGIEAVDDAVQQIARAASVLKGVPVAEAVLDLRKGLR